MLPEGPARRAQPASAAALVRGRPVTICIHSRYQFEGKLPIGIQIANKLRERARPIADYLEFESELTVRSPAEVAEMGLAKLTGLDTPSVGALEQNIFYVNQVMQFGKLLAVFQQHPTDANADRRDRVHGARGRVERPDQEEGIRERAGAAEPGAGAGAGRQELVQHRQLDQRRPAGLRATTRRSPRCSIANDGQLTAISGVSSPLFSPAGIDAAGVRAPRPSTTPPFFPPFTL